MPSRIVPRFHENCRIQNVELHFHASPGKEPLDESGHDAFGLPAFHEGGVELEVQGIAIGCKAGVDFRRRVEQGRGALPVTSVTAAQARGKGRTFFPPARQSLSAAPEAHVTGGRVESGNIRPSPGARVPGEGVAEDAHHQCGVCVGHVEVVSEFGSGKEFSADSFSSHEVPLYRIDHLKERMYFPPEHHLIDGRKRIRGVRHSDSLYAARVIDGAALRDVSARFQTPFDEHGRQRGRVKVAVASLDHLQVPDHALRHEVHLGPEGLDHLLHGGECSRIGSVSAEPCA